MFRSLATCLVLYVCFDLFSSYASAADQIYDVVVYGGTSGGIAAAVQAARMGKSGPADRAGQAPRRPDHRRPGRHRHRQQAGDRRHLARVLPAQCLQHYARPEAWKQENARSYRKQAAQPGEDTMWTFEPHVAEAILRRDARRGQGRRSSSASGSI